MALRRAWATDPAITGYKTLADYDWDFNAPGYGALRVTDNVKELADRVFGLLKAEEPEPKPEPDEPEVPEAEASVVEVAAVEAEPEPERLSAPSRSLWRRWCPNRRAGAVTAERCPAFPEAECLRRLVDPAKSRYGFFLPSTAGRIVFVLHCGMIVEV